MENYNGGRRAFLGTMGLLLGGGLSGFRLPSAKPRLKLAFSTIGCPDWPYERVLRFARDNGYAGVEIRGLLRVMDLTKAPEFSSAERIKTSRRMAEDLGLRIVNLGASAAMHHAPGPEREQALDEARRYADLAAALGCPAIRVFPDKLPANRDRSESFGLIAEGLRTVCRHAEGSGVAVLMETHGELLSAEDIRTVMGLVQHPSAGLVWDMANMWSVTKEAPGEAYPKISPWIRHVHVKDFRFDNGKMRYMLPGQGLSPLFQSLDLLRRGGYPGYYSFEWEKLWHPELEDEEKALQYYVQFMRAVEQR